MRSNKGFTLIELIMVTIILGILAAVAVPRYLGTVNKAEEAAERAVVDALRAAVEDYATQEFIENGRYRYPNNPFDLVDVDGYSGVESYGYDGSSDQLVDGEWIFEIVDDWGNGYGWGKIFHKRRDNSVYGWDYSWGDHSDNDSDDRGHNIGMGPDDWYGGGDDYDPNESPFWNQKVHTNQHDLSNNN